MRKYYSLIDKVYSEESLLKAYLKVRENKGAPGIDGVSVYAFGENLEDEIENLHIELKTGTYKPSAVRRVNIPKSPGKTRPLGIPSVRDRVVQQALKNVLEPIFEPDFHPSSYGYRPGRSCHMAIAKAELFLKRWRLKYAVDMDLSKCFDRLDHELIIDSVNRKVSDGKVLKLIRSFLESGVMEDGAFSRTEIGSPQGGVISPLLTNIYPDHFDQKMKERGIRIVRYADDILIFAGKKRRAKRYLKTAAKILEGELKLTINREKTHTTNLLKGVKFLGVVIRNKCIFVQEKKVKAFKKRVKTLTKRNCGLTVEEMVKKLNPVLRGWLNYFRMANCKSLVESLMEWIRRRLRMRQMKLWKSWKKLHKVLRRRNFKGVYLKISMCKWKNSRSVPLHIALPNKWFDAIGLMNMSEIEVGILPQISETLPCRKEKAKKSRSLRKGIG